MRKRKLFSIKQKDKIIHIGDMIKHHMWCPPPADIPDGGTKCGICGEEIGVNKKAPYTYAVWVGHVCVNCAKRYEKEIEELSCM